MMKRLLMVAAVMFTSFTAFAQNGLSSINAPKSQLSLSKALPTMETMKVQGKKAETTGERILMGGYTSDNYATSGLGFNAALDLKMAQYYPADLLKAYDGGKITGMRFAMANGNCTVTRAFIATVKSGAIADVLSKDVTWSQAGWCEVDFDDTYTIDASDVQGLLIGYDFTDKQNGYAMSFVNEGVILQTLAYGNLGNGVAWYNIDVGDYGNLSVQAYVEGLTKAPYGVLAFDFGEYNTLINQEVKANMSILGTGEENVSSLEYTLMINGVDKGNYTATFTNAVGFAQLGSFEVTIPAESAGKKAVAVNITKVNGNDLEIPAVGNAVVYVISRLAKRGVVVEEFTGTGCGWCPRGWAGMEKLRSKYGENFVGAAIHQYNTSDPMYLNTANYANLSFAGAPSCVINRSSGEIDPYYGSNNDDICKDFEKALNVPSKVEVNVTADYNDDATEVNAKATVEALIECGPYNIEFVLIADGLEGASSGWRQQNYYSTHSASEVGNDPDIAQFCQGGKYGQSSIFLTFNDVVVGSSYKANANTAEALGVMATGDVVEREFTLAMPTKAALKSVIKYDKMAVLVYVVNEDGTIENAAKYYVPASEELGIADNSTVKNATALGFYTVDGRQISQPQRGLNIVKMSDGTTMKIMVK